MLINKVRSFLITNTVFFSITTAAFADDKMNDSNYKLNAVSEEDAIPTVLLLKLDEKNSFNLSGNYYEKIDSSAKDEAVVLAMYKIRF